MLLGASLHFIFVREELLSEFVGVYKYTQRVGFLILATGVIPPGEHPLWEDCVKTHTIAQSREGTLLKTALN